MNRNVDIIDIAEEISRYLDAHPNAIDSLKGIAKWWISRQRIDESTIKVQRALDYLAAKGVVVKIIANDEQVVYAKPKAKQSS